MGNTNQKYTSFRELIFLDSCEIYDLNLKKYIGSGYTKKEAMENLSEICRINGIPEPTFFNSNYHCGTINFYIGLKSVTRLNTVFYKKRNGRFFAIVYYYDI